MTVAGTPEVKAQVKWFLNKPYTADELLIFLHRALHPAPG